MREGEREVAVGGVLTSSSNVAIWSLVSMVLLRDSIVSRTALRGRVRVWGAGAS